MATKIGVILDKARTSTREEEMKKSASEWQKSEDMLQGHNEENFDAGFQGNLEGNLGCQDFGRWLNLRGHEDGEEGEEVKDRGGICPSRHCRRQCKIFASGVNFSMFTHFLCFFPLKLLKLGEIDGVKFLA